jgi:hypothetical protein
LKKREWTPEMQAETTKKWNDLFREVEAALDEDPAGDEGASAGRRGGALSLWSFTGGDPGDQGAECGVWKDPSGLPAATQQQMQPFGNPKVHEFIQKAMAAQKK